ncbi:MAG TPA: hypothetical protein VGJ41_05075 [Nocardioides sp.]
MGGRVAALAAFVVVAGGLAGGSPSAGVTVSTDGPIDDGRAFVAAAERLVAVRLGAVEGDDRSGFLATVDPGNRDFLARQAAYFDNLGELPVETFELAVKPGGVPATIQRRGVTQFVVLQTLQLREYDASPVVTEDLYTFVKGPDGRPLLTDDRDSKFDSLNGWLPAPWDLGPVTLREQRGVLAVFDDRTAPYADEVTHTVADALEDVDRVVPVWEDHVVVYDSTDTTLMDRGSAMDVSDTAGLAFPVLRSPDDGRLAAMRFAINPDYDMSSASSFVFRHELTHVAVHSLDYASPVWLREGAADLVAAEEVPVAFRDLVLRRSAGQVAGATDLPEGRTFYEVDPGRSYALSLLACEWIAHRYGIGRLWRLMAAFGEDPATFDYEVDRVVRRELGLDTRQLTATAIAWAKSL